MDEIRDWLAEALTIKTTLNRAQAEAQSYQWLTYWSRHARNNKRKNVKRSHVKRGTKRTGRL